MRGPPDPSADSKRDELPKDVLEELLDCARVPQDRRELGAGYLKRLFWIVRQYHTPEAVAVRAAEPQAREKIARVAEAAANLLSTLSLLSDSEKLGLSGSILHVTSKISAKDKQRVFDALEADLYLTASGVTTHGEAQALYLGLDLYHDIRAGIEELHKAARADALHPKPGAMIKRHSMRWPTIYGSWPTWTIGD
jgi:hypothetical protein